MHWGCRIRYTVGAMSSDDDLMADNLMLLFKQKLDDGSFVYCFRLSGFYEAWSWLKGLVKDGVFGALNSSFCCLSDRLHQRRGIVGLSMSRSRLRDEKTNCSNLLCLLTCCFVLSSACIYMICLSLVKRFTY
jgi:hypothetical protein